MNQIHEGGTLICHIDAQMKVPAIHEVIQKCSVFSTLPDIDLFKKAVIEREMIETTGIGHGIAIAHGKVPDLTSVKVGLGLSECGVEYDAKDGKPVHFLFVIASSPNKQFEYIRTLSTLLRTVRSAEVREELLSLDELYKCDPFHRHGSTQGDIAMRSFVSHYFSWLWKNESKQ
ncbi:MAG: PTS sugar transporter subunit IIA [Sphaerochaetaceae bacterium]|nr:PTS sugar transporter subunit IIA [Sphaerochaetaceae bacterium]